jgi:N-methylhydantoinase A
MRSGRCRGRRRPREAIVGRQRVLFESGAVETPIYARGRLGAGAAIDGPAIVVQLDATTLILPGQRAETHPAGSLIVRE